MRTLLLADDNVTVQRVIALIFAGEPINVVAVSDGQQALERMAAEQPDIVLAGTSLPRVSGYDLAKFMRGKAELRNVPVLLLSGAFEMIDETRLAASGANGVLEKPVEPTVVISRVKELLGLKSGEKPATPGRAITPASVPADKKPPSRPDRLNARDPAEIGTASPIRPHPSRPPRQPTIRRAARAATSTPSTTHSIHLINSCRDARPERRRLAIPPVQSARPPALPIRDRQGARRR